MKILLVDDSLLIREIVTKMLKEAGFKNIHKAQNGNVGLKILREEGGFEFIISDWIMPGMNGLELLKAVRKDEKLKNTLFMILSAESIDEKVEAAIKEGADGYVTKPFTSEKLKAEIESIVSRHS